MKLLFFFWLIFFSFLAAPSLRAEDSSSSHQHQEIKVPLGFCWGDSPQKLEDVVRSGGLTITKREENPSLEEMIYVVHGVIGTALQQNLFVFRKNSLVEIEYQYGNKNWDGKNYEDFFEAFRRMYDTKYGLGTPLIKNSSKIDSSGIITSLSGYQWNQANALLALYYYSAEQQEKTYRLISLHYKAP
ncbi:MAG: hypothetical protein ACH346_05450 [Chthoniobacterales bacterium]